MHCHCVCLLTVDPHFALPVLILLLLCLPLIVLLPAELTNERPIILWGVSRLMAAAAAHSPPDDLAPPSEGAEKKFTPALEVHVSGDCCRRHVVFPDSYCQNAAEAPKAVYLPHFLLSIIHLHITVFGMPA